MPQNTTISPKQNNSWVILSPSKWSDLKVSNHLISEELSNLCKEVFYVESPGVIGLKLNRIFKILYSLLKRKNLINIFNKNNNKNNLFFKYSNLKLISKFPLPFIGIPFIDNIIFNFNFKNRELLFNLFNNADNFLICSPIWIPIFFEWFYKNKKRKINFYFHLVDDIESYSHLKYYMKILKDNIDKFNYVISPNKILLEKYAKKKNYLHLTHGFDCVLKEIEYKNIINDNKSIVYAGTFANWLDYQLIDEICNKFFDKDIFLIGKPARDIALHDLKNIEKRNKNLTILNSMNKKELHKFLKRCSVAIVPYKSKLLHIKNCSPSKIMDYLGCGLPVISSSIPYCIQHKFVRTSDKNKLFLDEIEKCFKISKNTRVDYVNYALKNTWKDKARFILKNI